MATVLGSMGTLGVPSNMKSIVYPYQGDEVGSISSRRDMEPEISLEDRLRRTLGAALNTINTLDGMQGPIPSQSDGIGPAGVFVLAAEVEKITNAIEQRVAELARRIGAL